MGWKVCIYFSFNNLFLFIFLIYFVLNSPCCRSRHASIHFSRSATLFHGFLILRKKPLFNSAYGGLCVWVLCVYVCEGVYVWGYVCKGACVCWISLKNFLNIWLRKFAWQTQQHITMSHSNTHTYQFYSVAKEMCNMSRFPAETTGIWGSFKPLK